MAARTEATSWPIGEGEHRGRIDRIRGQQVMIDGELAELYGVAVKVLNQSVRRNLKRFPPEFMFQLTPVEHEIIRSQFVTGSRRVEKLEGRLHIAETDIRLLRADVGDLKALPKEPHRRVRGFAAA